MISTPPKPFIAWRWLRVLPGDLSLWGWLPSWCEHWTDALGSEKVMINLERKSSQCTSFDKTMRSYNCTVTWNKEARYVTLEKSDPFQWYKLTLPKSIFDGILIHSVFQQCTIGGKKVPVYPQSPLPDNNESRTLWSPQDCLASCRSRYISARLAIYYPDVSELTLEVALLSGYFIVFLPPKQKSSRVTSLPYRSNNLPSLASMGRLRSSRVTLINIKHCCFICCRYIMDETSPSAIESEWEVNYEILSKTIKQKKPTAGTVATAPPCCTKRNAACESKWLGLNY